MTKQPLGAVALAAGLLCACVESQAATEPRGDAAPPDVLVAARGDFTNPVLLTGQLEAEDAILLIAPNVNIWPLQVRWVAQDGVVVAEGDVAVEFDSSQLTNNLEEMKVQALEAESALDSEMARVASEIDAAEFELERQKAAATKARLDAEVPARLLSDREHERRQLELQKAELELAGAQRKLDNARRAGDADVELKRVALTKAVNEVVRAETSIAKLTLEAPREGILVIGENRQEGRPVRPGDTVWPGQVVAQLPDLETLAVAARLFDVDDGRVLPGQAVRARLDAFPDRVYTGRVREADEVANQDGRLSLRRFFNVKIALDEVDPELMRPGMSVKVVIAAPPLEDVLLVPRAALDWSGGEPRAVAADRSLKPVELGPCNAFHCVVKAGLEEGEELARAWEVWR